CLQSERPGTLTASLACIAVLAAVVGMPWHAWQMVLKHMSNLLTLSPDATLWGSTAGYSRGMFLELSLVAAGVITLLLLLVVHTMVPLGRWVGFYFDQAEDVFHAYSINLAGSVAGAWLLAGLALLWLPPTYWIAM